MLFVRLVVSAQDLQELQKKTSEFTLPNGLHFIVLQRQESPVVAFHTFVNVGSMQDPGGQTGLAHMFEHLAFKGTENIGTRGWPEEKKALDAVEEAYDRMDAEANKGVKADRMRVDMLRSQYRMAVCEVWPIGDYRRILEENGASISALAPPLKVFLYLLPTAPNSGFLWNARLMHPAFREFYRTCGGG
jgi:predicted Zn-dependent peptidase